MRTQRMGTRLKGKVALITGAGMGMGREAAVLFAEEGARVVVCDINKQAAEETVALVGKAGGEGLAAVGDVAIEEDVKRMVEEGARRFGALHVLYNNAGVLWKDKDRSVLETDGAQWDRVVAINLKSVFWVTKHGIPHLQKAGGGSIILVGSVSALAGITRAQDAYTAAKGALISLNKSLAIQFAKDQIPSNIIHPGIVETPLQAPYLTPKLRAGFKTAIPLRAPGRLLLVAPTGGGKSLIYQLPALLLGGTTLVISPLIALMQDQVEALNARGVPATFLASTVESGEMRARMAAAARGAYRLLYVAPERLTFSGFKSVIAALHCPLVAVDEAHCISEWGHDFRPEYLEIGALLVELSGARVLACTATATPVVRDEILARLGLPADTPQLVRGFARPNLSLRAVEVEDRRDRVARVEAALAEALGRPGEGRGAAIVYAPTRRSAEEEGARLARLGWHARVYHAGLSPGERDRAQRDFLEGRAEVIVATNAFGMGLDRADVRAVVHLGPPSSLEAYYQEVGRAGRDGAPALGLLLISSRDLPLRRALIERGGEGAAPDPAVVEHKWGLFLELMRWAEGGSCRHDAILRYFGDEAETLHGCGRCDVCRVLVDPGEAHDAHAVTLIVRTALSGVPRARGLSA